MPFTGCARTSDPDMCHLACNGPSMSSANSILTQLWVKNTCEQSEYLQITLNGTVIDYSGMNERWTIMFIGYSENMSL